MKEIGFANFIIKLATQKIKKHHSEKSCIIEVPTPINKEIFTMTNTYSTTERAKGKHLTAIERRKIAGQAAEKLSNRELLEESVFIIQPLPMNLLVVKSNRHEKSMVPNIAISSMIQGMLKSAMNKSEKSVTAPLNFIK